MSSQGFAGALGAELLRIAKVTQKISGCAMRCPGLSSDPV